MLWRLVLFLSINVNKNKDFLHSLEYLYEDNIKKKKNVKHQNGPLLTLSYARSLEFKLIAHSKISNGHPWIHSDLQVELLHRKPLSSTTTKETGQIY